MLALLHHQHQLLLQLPWRCPLTCPRVSTCRVRAHRCCRRSMQHGQLQQLQPQRPQ